LGIRRHTPEQIVRKLREAQRLLAERSELPDVCRSLEISIQTAANGEELAAKLANTILLPTQPTHVLVLQEVFAGGAPHN
jgi:hypothetical protein